MIIPKNNKTHTETSEHKLKRLSTLLEISIIYRNIKHSIYIHYNKDKYKNNITKI